MKTYSQKLSSMTGLQARGRIRSDRSRIAIASNEFRSSYCEMAPIICCKNCIELSILFKGNAGAFGSVKSSACQTPEQRYANVYEKLVWWPFESFGRRKQLCFQKCTHMLHPKLDLIIAQTAICPSALSPSIHPDGVFMTYRLGFTCAWSNHCRCNKT